MPFCVCFDLGLKTITEKKKIYVYVIVWFRMEDLFIILFYVFISFFFLSFYFHCQGRYINTHKKKNNFFFLPVAVLVVYYHFFPPFITIIIIIVIIICDWVPFLLLGCLGQIRCSGDAKIERVECIHVKVRLVYIFLPFLTYDIKYSLSGGTNFRN